ncbi:MAG: prephenate dehydrogenase [Clostridia bacterium]
MKTDCMAVAGVGLIGGSMAKALKIRAGVKKIIGIDPDPAVRDEAVRAGVLDEAYPRPGTYLESCGMVFVCAPVPLCAALAIEISKYTDKDCVITDTASSKSGIIGIVESYDRPVRFIGGHPMAGSERSGFQYSREDMFENAYYLIIGNPGDREAEESVVEIAKKIGAIPMITDAESHDSAVAIISHVPHVAAAALVNLLEESNVGDLGRQIAAGGFRDITRIASSQPALWSDITLSNKKAVSDGTEKLIRLLEGIKDSINMNDAPGTGEFFSRAKEARDVISGEREGLLPRRYQVVVQVPDKPGMIARVATVLGDSGVNIRNINVAHSREDIGGVLVVELYTSDDRNMALETLEKNGFSVAAID